MLDAELIADVESLQALTGEGWDQLAAECRLPMMTSGLILPWWRHIAPHDAEPRTVAVREAGKLVGLAPFYVTPTKSRTDYRLPGIELAARLSPLAVPGREWEIAAIVAKTLAEARPRPDLIALEGNPVGSHWALAIRSGWPGALRPPMRRYLVQGAPTISLQNHSYESWLAAKSSNFRSQMRRLRRKFDAVGGVARISTRDTLTTDIGAFLHMHTTRWSGRGQSGFVALAARLPALLEDAAASQLDHGGFRMWILEVDGEPISAQFFFAINGEVAYINGGWDERFASLKPAMLGILHAVEDSFARGENRIDLGGGEQPYKLRFSDGNDPVAWSILAVPAPRLPVTLASLAPMLVVHALRDSAKHALSPEQTERLRAVSKHLRR